MVFMQKNDMESKQIRLDQKYKSLEKGFFDIENDGVLYLS